MDEINMNYISTRNIKRDELRVIRLQTNVKNVRLIMSITF